MVSALVTENDATAKTTGLQRKILFYIVEDCIFRGRLTSGFISSEVLREVTKTTTKTIKTATQRLINKGLIKREKGQRGRGGFCSFIITENVKDSVLKEKRNSSISNQLVSELVTTISNQLVTNREAHREPNPSSSSSSYINNLNINKTTITADDKKNFLPEEWLKIDTTPLEHIHFSKTQLRQLVDKNLPEIVQESINLFAYEILQEPEKYTQPLNVLMGVLRQGNAWASPKGYEAPKDKAQREYFERKKAENEKRNQFVSELMDLEFLDWQSRLSDQDLEYILPEDVRASRLTAAKTSVLKNYFKDHVLIPRLKNEGLY